jgi:zinc-ribbon domain
MRVGNRFCSKCGHQLSPAARFCSKCGRAVPASAEQSAAQPGRQIFGVSPQQSPDPPTIASPMAGRAANQRGGARSSEEAPGPDPPGKAPPGTRPPRPRPPVEVRRRPSYLLPLVAVLAVLIAGGGSAAAVLLMGHSHQHHAAPGKLAATAATSAPTSAPPASPSPPPPPTQVTVDGMTINVGAVNTDPDATAVATTLGTYFGGIDTRNYRQAWDTYSAALQAATPLQPLANALSTSQDSMIVLRSIRNDGNGNLDVDVAFQSHQAGQYGPNPGETCTNWSLDYHLVPAADAAASPVSLSYLINQVTDVGPGHSRC